MSGSAHSPGVAGFDVLSALFGATKPGRVPVEIERWVAGAGHALAARAAGDAEARRVLAAYRSAADVAAAVAQAAAPRGR